MFVISAPAPLWGPPEIEQKYITRAPGVPRRPTGTLQLRPGAPWRASLSWLARLPGFRASFVTQPPGLGGLRNFRVPSQSFRTMSGFGKLTILGARPDDSLSAEWTAHKPSAQREILPRLSLEFRLCARSRSRVNWFGPDSDFRTAPAFLDSRPFKPLNLSRPPSKLNPKPPSNPQTKH